MNKFKWRTQYDETEDAQAEAETIVYNTEPSLTQQHFKDDADLNKIVQRYGITDGTLAPQALDPKYYGDFSDVNDFRQSLDNIRDANERFDDLPAALRDQFGNNPISLWSFVNDPANHNKAVELGLLRRAEQPAQTTVPDTPKTT